MVLDCISQSGYTHSHCNKIFSREKNWIASGSFDRTIKIWDLASSNKSPLATLTLPDTSAPKSSIYALAVDPFGHLVTSGSPERVIRLWDPRSGKRIGEPTEYILFHSFTYGVGTGKLVGHTDNIRAMIISADSKYVSWGQIPPRTYSVSYSLFSS